MAKAKKEESGNVYKIRDTRTGLWSCGGTWPHFDKKGKTWNKIGHVKTHLNQFEDVPDYWEVVEVEMRECALNPAKDFFTPPSPTDSYRSTAPGMQAQAPKVTLAAVMAVMGQPVMAPVLYVPIAHAGGLQAAQIQALNVLQQMQVQVQQVQPTKKP